MRQQHFIVAALGLLILNLPAVQANLLSNGTLELPPGAASGTAPLGWSLLEGPDDELGSASNSADLAPFANHTPGGDQGLWLRSFVGGQTATSPRTVFAHLQQTVPAIPGQRYVMTGWSRFETFYSGGVDNLNLPGTDTTPPDDGLASPTDTFFALEFLDAGSSALPGSVVLELRSDGQINDSTWREHTLSGIAPAGTVNVRVRASMVDGLLNNGANPQSAFVDDFALVPEPATAAGLFIILALSARRRRAL